MLTKQVVEFFGGSQAHAARQLGITRAAITNWKKYVPASALWRVVNATGGKLKPDPDFYQEKADEVAEKIVTKRAKKRRAKKIAKGA